MRPSKQVLHRIALSISALLIGVVLLIFIYELVSDKQGEWATITKDQMSMVKSGDIIFTEGISFKSDIVRLLGSNGDYKYSHCGIAVIREDYIYIVHMSIDHDMIKQEYISDFLVNNRVRSFAIYRSKEDIEANLIKDTLNRLLEECTTFDNSYDAAESTKLYCTELVCLIYSKTQNISLYPHLDRTEKIFPNELITYSKLQKII